MAWNIPNILVNEAIANKKAGGGESDLSERVTVLETNVSDLLTTVSGLNPNVYSPTETKIGKWGNEDLYRIEVDCGNLPHTATKLVSSGLTGITVKKIYGYAEKTDVTLPLPYIAMTNVNCVELYYKVSTNEINITTGSDKSEYTAKVVLEYIKNPVPERNIRKKKS